MYCPQCGSKNPDIASFCGTCGFSFKDRQPLALRGNQASSQTGTAIPKIDSSSFLTTPTPYESAPPRIIPVATPSMDVPYGTSAPHPAPLRGLAPLAVPAPPFAIGLRRPIKSDRSTARYVILSLITLGFYSYYFIYHLAQDVAVLCADGRKVPSSLAAFILLSCFTLGFYSVYWMYRIANQLYSSASSYGMHFVENGRTILLWALVGLIICGIGPFVAMSFNIRNTNRLATAYNARYVFNRESGSNLRDRGARRPK